LKVADEQQEKGNTQEKTTPNAEPLAEGHLCCAQPTADADKK